MKCYICSQNFPSVKALILHMKIKHSFTDGPINCMEEGCYRNFTNLNSFRKHCKYKHKVLEMYTETQPVYNSNTNNSEQSTSTSAKKVRCETVASDAATQNNMCFNTDTFLKTIYIFVAELYTNDTVPRSAVQTIITKLVDIFDSEFIRNLHSSIVLLLENLKCNSTAINSVNNCFDTLKNPFADILTEYKRFKYFQNSGFFVSPKDTLFGEEVRPKITNCSSVLESKVSKGSFIPLRCTLQKMFELPDVYNMTSKYIADLEIETHVTENFVQSPLWRSIKSSYGEKAVYPIFVYFDDYDTGNVLGSHSGLNKLGAVYASVPCFPPQFNSLLENIFLVQLFKSSDRKTYGNKVFTVFIDEMNYLSRSGITIKISESEIKTIYFALGLCIGDNLGLNSMLGFVESFSSTYYCRFCKTSKHEAKHQQYEDESKIRNFLNYQEDVFLSDYSLTGIKEKCIFNNIDGFHVTNNLCVDIMHDILEGVCNYDIALILTTFIYDLKLFSLETLNSKIDSFYYGSFTNTPTKINEQVLKKGNIKMSASEMLCFVSYLGVMVGHYVPEGNNYWNLYVVLMKILHIIMDKVTIPENEHLLKSLISEHHYIYCVILKQELKPKHHNMVHYPRILSQVGPLVHTWSMRFEARHRPSKVTANASCSRKNICLTLAIKNQLQMCYRLLSCNGFNRNQIEYGPIELNYLTSYPYSNILSDKNIDIVESYKWVKQLGVTFKKQSAIVIKTEQLPQFGKILDIVNANNNTFIIYEELHTVHFSEHIQAYEIKSLSKMNVINLTDIHSSCHSVTTCADGKFCVIKQAGM